VWVRDTESRWDVIVFRAVYWKQGIAMIAGGIGRRIVGAHYAQKYRRNVDRFVVLVGAGMTAYFFWKSY